MLSMHLSQQLHDSDSDGRVQRSGRFVGKQQVRAHEQRHGNHNPLPHPPTQFMGVGAQNEVEVVKFNRDERALYLADSFGGRNAAISPTHHIAKLRSDAKGGI